MMRALIDKTLFSKNSLSCCFYEDSKQKKQKALRLSVFNLLGLSQMTFLTEEYFIYVGLPYGTDLIFILRSAR